MREISVQNTIRMWDTYLVRPIIVLPILTRSLNTRMYPGGGHRRVLAVPSVRLLGVSGPVEQEAAGDGLPGELRSTRVPRWRVSLTAG